jgi:hypothetical protein
MTDRGLLRLSASLLFIGLVLLFVAELPHPGGGATQEETFANYAAISVEAWAAIHLGQFVSEAILVAGLLFLYFALNVSEGPGRWLAIFGALATGMALALAAVLYAVDGVALKQAVDAWASAPAAEKATFFASAEAIRWLEFGMNSYWEYLRGLALVLYGSAIVWTARVPRPIGALMGVAGLALLDLGWLVGTRGFTTANNVPQDVVYGCFLAMAIWLLVVAWTERLAGPAKTGSLRSARSGDVPDTFEVQHG